MLDVHAIGRTLEVTGDKTSKSITRREWVNKIDEGERLKRVRAVIHALGQMGDFAKQARNAVSFAPDIFFAAVLPAYTQRGLRTLEMNAEGSIEIETLKVVAADLAEYGGVLFAGHTPGVVKNDADFLAACAEMNVSVGSPVATLRRVAEAVA